MRWVKLFIPFTIKLSLSMSQSVKRKISGFVLLCLLLLLTLLLLYLFGLHKQQFNQLVGVNRFLIDSDYMKQKPEDLFIKRLNRMGSWKTVDLQRDEIPEDILSLAKQAEVHSKTIQMQNGNIFYLESQPTSPNKMSILLLHGMSFSSQNWLQLGTIQLFSALDYRTVAIDLPGFGNTSKIEMDKKEEFLRNFIAAIHLNNPVIITPSFSGHYAIPFLIKFWHEISGLVTVAPMGSEALKGMTCSSEDSRSNIVYIPEKLRVHLDEPIPNAGCIELPVMNVFGEHDISRGLKTTALLSLLPNAQTVEVPGARHAAYLDNPKLWHKLLFNFLKQLSVYRT